MQNVRETMPIGSIVGGRYQIEQVLGKGGFSAVYLVRDQRVHQNVFALKEIVDPDKPERDRFAFEAKLLTRVDHPALPRVYRVFEDDLHDRAYMLMDYIEGSNLERLRRQQPNKQFPVQQVLAMMQPIMEAVSFLHEQHPPIIHRDIKPANIIVPTSGTGTVLVDLGIAKEFDPESTTTAVRHASPGYGAPEQYSTGTNTRTDLYGLGATMYVLLTGVVPADAFYRTTQLGSKGIDPLEPIQRYAPGVPQNISNAIYRSMALDIDDRFPTVRDFWTALNSLPSAQSPALHLAGPLAFAALPSPTVREVPLSSVYGTRTLAAQPERTEGRRKRGLWLLLLAVLLIAIAAAALILPSALSHLSGSTASTPTVVVKHHPTATVTPRLTATPRSTVAPRPAVTPTPSPTTVPSPTPTTTPPPGVPVLASQYNGTLHNTPADVNANMSLQSIKQQGGNIRGTFQVSSPLLGSGPFTGTINSSGHILFTVYSSQVAAPLQFQGKLQGDGSLSGTYCSLDQTGHCNPAAGGYGTWQVFPPSPGPGSLSYTPKLDDDRTIRSTTN